MDNSIFEAVMGTKMPADNSAGSSAMANQLRGDSEIGQFLSIAPGFEEFGQNMQTGAMDKAKTIGTQRGKGLTRAAQAARDKEALRRNQYTEGRDTEQDTLEQTRYDEQQRLAEEARAAGLTASELDHKRAIELQGLKDDEAANRARIAAAGEAAGTMKMPASEKKNFRVARMARTGIPELLAQAEAQPDAFGPGQAIESWLPDGTPNFATEAVRQWEAAGLTNEQQQARVGVLQQSYQIINQLAGAALSKTEKDRIEAFTPAPGDTFKTVMNKLAQAEEYAQRQDKSFSMYSDYIPYEAKTATEDVDAAVADGDAAVVDDDAAKLARADEIRAKLAAMDAASQQGGMQERGRPTALPQARRQMQRGRNTGGTVSEPAPQVTFDPTGKGRY